VTGDAAFMQRAVGQLILKPQGHSLSGLKTHQPERHQTVQAWFEPVPPARRVSVPELDLSSGRMERRNLWARPIYDDGLA